MKKIIISVIVIVCIVSGFFIIKIQLNWVRGEMTKKPVIYLYPKENQHINVKLNYSGELTCTYPAYTNGWDVIAQPNGELINKADGRSYQYLYWEGKTKKNNWDLSSGFVIKGEDTLLFLQEKLSELGLTDRELNDFIAYWLPYMIHNKYNLIKFAGSEYEEVAKLDINPEPDSVLRVFMVFKPLDKFVEVERQIFKPFERTGFTVVEWGGTEVN